MRLVVLLILLLTANRHGHALEGFVIEGDEVKIEGRVWMRSAFSQNKVWLYDRLVTIKIFDRLMKEFPGNNSQLIQILDEQGASLAIHKLGGEPMFISARIVPYFQTALVYVACTERRMRAQTEYIYKIEKDLTLVPFNVYISSEEAEKAQPKAIIDAKGEKAVEQEGVRAGDAVSAPAPAGKP